MNSKVADTLNKLTAPEATIAKPASAKDAKELTDPSPDQIQNIIQEFAAKEKIFSEARNNYTYHQINKVEELGPDNEIVGIYEQEWDILYDDTGKRIEKVTYAPVDTLKRFIVTKEDISSFAIFSPLSLPRMSCRSTKSSIWDTSRWIKLPPTFSPSGPRKSRKSGSISRASCGLTTGTCRLSSAKARQCPKSKTKKGENLFPRFTTWREQVDGKFWFPTYTMADDTLYFSNGARPHEGNRSLHRL